MDEHRWAGDFGRRCCIIQQATVKFACMRFDGRNTPASVSSSDQTGMSYYAGGDKDEEEHVFCTSIATERLGELEWNGMGWDGMKESEDQ